jgi:hypothetical protein
MSVRFRWVLLTVLLVGGVPGLPARALPASSNEVVVWESGGLTDDSLKIIDLVARITDARYTTVDTGSLRMMSVTRGDVDVQRPEPGFGYPMMVSAVDPGTAGPLLGPALAGALNGDSAAMSERSAALRGARVGDMIELEGWNGAIEQVRVATILPDDQLDWVEIVISRRLADRLELERPSSVWMWGSDRAGSLLESLLPAGAPVTVTPSLAREASSDRPLPTVAIKERFGEFSFRPASGDLIEVDEKWRAESIVTVEMPVLGEFKCHRRVVPYLRAAMAQVEAEGLLALIDPVDFQLAGGCYNARLMRGGDKGFAVSRHAWGAAFDLNPSTNQYGDPPLLDERLGRIMQDWGFVWGAGWTVPDGMHFEWGGPPTVAAIAPCAGAGLVAPTSTPTTWAVYARDRECQLD